MLKRFFCAGMIAASLLAIGQSADSAASVAVAGNTSALVSIDFGSVDDLVQTLTPRAKIQRAAPNTWSSRFETRFNARWNGTAQYIV